MGIWQERGVSVAVEITLAPAEEQLLKEQATYNKMSVAEFSRKAIMKAVNNSQYLAQLDKSYSNMEAGNFKHFANIEELRHYIHGNQL